MMKTLIYFHGFQSGAGTATVGRFRRCLHDWRVEAPDIPQDPLEALDFLRTLCAHQMVGYRRIAVNPALHLSEMPEILHVGQYHYLQPRLSGETTFEITDEIIRHFREAEQRQWDHLRDRDGRAEPILGFFGTRDTTVDCRSDFEQYYGTACTDSFDGEHRMSDRVVSEVLAPVVRSLA